MKNSKTAKVVSGVVSLATALLMVGPSIASAAYDFTFSATLKQGVTSSEVKNLQTILNSDVATQVAASGVGSAGMETSYFGAKTKAAVAKFQEKYAADILTPIGLTKGTGLVGAATRAKLNAIAAGSSVSGSSLVPGCTSTVGFSPTTGQSCSASVVVTPTATGTSMVSAMIDPTSPAAMAMMPGTSAKVAVFKLTNSGSSAAKITAIKLKRAGVASDSALRNVYLYSGAQRITDSATVASGVVNFTDNSGIITIPAGGTISLGVMVELDATAAVASNVIGLNLTDVVADAGTASGVPVVGALHSVVQAPSDIATVYFNNTTNPVTGTQVDPQVDYVVWQNTIQVGSRDALLSMIRYRQTGSVSAGDLTNFRLYVGGVQVGSSIDKVGSDGYVTFDLTSSPVVLKSGGRELKVLADVVGGSNKTFAFSLQQAVDAMFWDSQLNVVLQNHVGSASGSFTPVKAPNAASPYDVNTVKEGAITIAKSTDSPSGNVINQGSGVTLAKYDFKATGERLKVENLVVGFSSSDSSVGSIRNGALFVNGAQVGSTGSIASTTFNLGSSLILEPGKTTVVEVRGDVFDNNGSNDLNQGDTLKIILGAGSQNIYKMSSYGYTSAPGSAVSANSLTVTDGSLTLSKYTAMANQTVTVPQTAYKIGEYRITAGATEGVNLSSFTLNIASSSGSTADLQDVYLVYGAKTSSVKSTVTSTGNTFSVNEPIVSNSTLPVAVYATINTSLSTNNIITSLSVTGTSQNAGNSVSVGSVLGQTVTGGNGTFTAVVDASTPVAAQVVGNSMPKVASFKFTGLYDNFAITELWFNATGSAAIGELIVKDGGTEVKRQSFNGTDLRMTGLSVSVPNNQNKVLDVYANLGPVGTGNASTSQNVSVALYGLKYRGSTGNETTTGGPGSGSAFYAFKTKPTVANVALPTTVLSAGTQTIAKFTVTADAGGTVAWRKISLSVATSGVVATNFRIYDSANESTILNGTAAVANVDMNGRVTFTSATQDQEVSGSKTYVVKADIGAVATGNSISTSIPQLGSAVVPNSYATVSAAAGSFIWSDESVIGHDGTTADWSNDYLVKNLPTDSQTLTK